MKKKIYNWLYKFAIKVIAINIVKHGNQLTHEYLLKKGWIEKDDFWIEPNAKERDKIWIQFEHHYFKIWHGKERTFIGLESKVEWFEVYYLLTHGDNGRYELAGV